MNRKQLALADRVVEWLAANPDMHQQDRWRCRTGMCFAGATCELAGGRWLYDIDDCTIPDYEFSLVGHLLHPEGDETTVLTHRLQDKRIDPRGVPAEWRARSLLGLDLEDADDLFASNNTLDDIRGKLDELRARIDAGDNANA